MRVVTVSDHALLEAGLRAVLEGAGHRVIERVDRAWQAGPLVRRSGADAVIVDAGVRGASPIEIMRAVAQHAPSVRRYAVGVPDSQTAGALADLGVVVALGRGEPPSRLLEALAVEPVEGNGRRRRVPANRRLSRREAEVLGLLAQGMTTNEVARRLVLSPETARTYVKSAMRKLDARTRVEAVLKAVTSGEVSTGKEPAASGAVRLLDLVADVD